MRSLLTGLMIAVGTVSGSAATFTSVYSFTGQSGDGASPFAAITVGPGGVLYGTTGYGGIFGAGTVYQLTPNGGGWTEAVLYSFTGGADGAYPQSGVILGPGGVLYGTTSAGGSAGMGTVYQLTPGAGGAWTETVLHSFSGSDGGYPYATPTLASSGALYGSTELGGAMGYGAVFALMPPTAPGGAWTETLLYNFAGGADGSFPYAGLAVDSKGNLYGTTIFGGASQKGTVFKLTPPTKAGKPWTETLLHSFTGSDGAFPFAGLIIGPSGALFGTTTGGVTAGYGTAFMLTPPTSGGAWTQTILRAFTPGPKGTSPHAALTAGPSGTLLGTDLASGSAPSFAGYGVVFQLTPAGGGIWNETVLYTFQGGSDGGDPDAALVAGPGGTYYGATMRGGNSGLGTVFAVTP